MGDKSFLAVLWAWLLDLAKLNLRKFLVWAGLAGAAVAYNFLNGPGKDGDVPLPDVPDVIWPTDPFGWIPPTNEQYQRTLQTATLFRETEAGTETNWRDGDSILAYRLFTKGAGKPFGPHQQGEIGCCVSFGSGGATELSLAANIALRRGPAQSFDSVCREAIYGGGRINIKRFDVPSEGMMGSWAAEWLDKSGAVAIGQKVKGNAIGPYSVPRCRDWGSKGVPADVVSLGAVNPVKTALVQNADDVKNALANGYFVFICSSVGFGDLNGPPLARDKDGFLKAKGQWPHCMIVAAYRADRKGFLIVNSWGPNWVTGPKGFGDEPEGSFWCEYATMQNIVKGNTFEPPDSYAVSSVGGFKKRLLDPGDWFVNANRRGVNEVARILDPCHFGWAGTLGASDDVGYP